ncbi:MAG TPA: hypothetical protein VF486_02725 [Actinomycetes bacterium]
MSPKPGQEGPSRLDLLKVWLLDPRSRIAVRRRLAEVRITRRSLLAAGMAVWLLYAALVWQFGGRRLEGCTSVACRALLGGLPFGQGGASPPAVAAGSASPTPTTGHVVLTPGTPPTSSAATTTTTLVVALLPSATGAPPPAAGEPTSTTAPASTGPGVTTTTSTTAPEPQCKPKKHRECKPKKHAKAMHWWWRWAMVVLGRGR